MLNPGEHQLWPATTWMYHHSSPLSGPSHQPVSYPAKRVPVQVHPFGGCEDDAPSHTESSEQAWACGQYLIFLNFKALLAKMRAEKVEVEYLLCHCFLKQWIHEHHRAPAGYEIKADGPFISILSRSESNNCHITSEQALSEHFLSFKLTPPPLQLQG